MQHALLFWRRKPGEMLQLPAQLLLPLRGQTAECRIALQGAFLFPRRHIPVPAKPIAGVAWTRIKRPRAILMLRRRRVIVVMLRQAWRHYGGLHRPPNRPPPTPP